MSSLSASSSASGSLSMRPTFQVVVPIPKQDLQLRIHEQLSKGVWNWESYSFDGYFEMHVPAKEVRCWSPHLSISMDAHGDETRIHGRFAPRQQVWTLVWVLYLAFVFSALFALLFALSSMHANDSEWRWIWILCPTSVLGIVLLYIVSYVGQSWSRDQIHSLKSQWDELIASVSHS
ncbi:MAG: hypothetical protein ACK5PB_15760 [Pirellula sp.]